MPSRPGHIPWEGSARRAELPKDWPRIRQLVIARDRTCRWRLSSGRACGESGNQVDHVGDRHDHRLVNLQLLCERHHKIKTAREANAARVPLHRPRGKHPGLL